jgi:hypothetical protein
MNVSDKDQVLAVHNDTARSAKLKFRCGEHPVWEAWVPSQGHIEVPDPRLRPIAGHATLRDPGSGVAYRCPLQLAGPGAALRASLLVVEHALDFQLAVEAAHGARELELFNDTAGGVLFVVRWPDTPFLLAARLGPASSSVIRLDAMQVAAVCDGATSASVSVDRWSGQMVIHRPDGRNGSMPCIARRR